MWRFLRPRVNIYQEPKEDAGRYIPDNGYPKNRADQGVPLLNTVLTGPRPCSEFPSGNRMGCNLPMRQLRCWNEQDRPIVSSALGKALRSRRKTMLKIRKHLDSGCATCIPARAFLLSGILRMQAFQQDQ